VRSERSAAPSSVRQLQEAGKAVAGAAGNVAVDRVRTEVGARSSRAAVELKAMAIAARASASSLRDQGHVSEADVVDRVAGRADRLAAYLGTASTDELVDEARRLSREAAEFARREPLLVVAGGFAMGLLIPKVLDVLGSKEASIQTSNSRSTSSSRSTSRRKKVDPRTTQQGESA
jgi:hypothetical protein